MVYWLRFIPTSTSGWDLSDPRVYHFSSDEYTMYDIGIGFGSNYTWHSIHYSVFTLIVILLLSLSGCQCIHSVTSHEHNLKVRDSHSFLFAANADAADFRRINCLFSFFLCFLMQIYRPAVYIFWPTNMWRSLRQKISVPRAVVDWLALFLLEVQLV